MDWVALQRLKDDDVVEYGELEDMEDRMKDYREKKPTLHLVYVYVLIWENTASGEDKELEAVDNKQKQTTEYKETMRLLDKEEMLRASATAPVNIYFPSALNQINTQQEPAKKQVLINGELVWVPGNKKTIDLLYRVLNSLPASHNHLKGVLRNYLGRLIQINAPLEPEEKVSIIIDKTTKYRKDKRDVDLFLLVLQQLPGIFLDLEYFWGES